MKSKYLTSTDFAILQQLNSLIKVKKSVTITTVLLTDTPGGDSVYKKGRDARQEF